MNIKIKEFLLLMTIVNSAISFFFCFIFFLLNLRDSSIPNINLQSFLLILMVISASLAIGCFLFYFLYLEKKWYGN